MIEKENVVTQVVALGLCCGCGVCAGICPCRSLDMRFNDIGEYNPYPTEITCIKCGLCLKVCPFSNQSDNEDKIGFMLFGSFEEINHAEETGYYIDTLLGYSNAHGHRLNGSSGGLATWVLESLLASKKVDAVACVKPSPGGHPLFEYSLCHTPEEIRKCSRSCYYPVEISSIIRMIMGTEGRYAIIALPCVCKALRLSVRSVPRLAARLKYLLGLTCGHTVSSNFAEFICGMAGGNAKKLESMLFRVKEPATPVSNYITSFFCRGENGDELKKIYWSQGIISAFMNRYFTPISCEFCDDVFAECADAVFMDAWLPEYSNHWEGHSIMLIRHPGIKQLISDNRNNDIVLEAIDISRVTESQAAALMIKRSYLPVRMKIAAKSLPKIPNKRYSRMSKVRISLLKKLYIRAQWDVARSTNRLWLQSNRDIPSFYRLSKLLRIRLTWTERFSSLFDDPVVTLKRWIRRIISHVN